MTTASVYMFNQTNLTANITINNGNQFSITGTSDTAKWVAQTSVQTFQTPGTVPGNFNAKNNTLLITLGNNQTYKYTLDIENSNPGSIEIHIFFNDSAMTMAGLIMLYEGGPPLQTLSVVTPTPIAVHRQTGKPLAQ